MVLLQKDAEQTKKEPWMAESFLAFAEQLVNTVMQRHMLSQPGGRLAAA